MSDMGAVAAKVLKPGDTIGILGGGQLGRMLAMAAAQLGLKTHIFAPETSSPAIEVAAFHTVAAYDDEQKLAAFAAEVDAITFEFENIPLHTAEFLEKRKPLRPSSKALALTQDRVIEKTFLNDLGIETAPFRAVDDLAGLQKAIAALGLPAILKTRRMGYDGKGQVKIKTRDEAEAAWHAIAGQPAILEGLIDLKAECSVILARNPQGQIAAFDLNENVHENHILARTIVPAQNIPSHLENEAREAAITIANALGYCGTLSVEFFIAGEGASAKLIANEIAPRVHNSGHWTIEGAASSQFQQHIRAVAGWPLGSARRHFPVVMENLLGHDVDRWHALLQEPETFVHLYGKGSPREGRKMGHITRKSA